MSTKVVNLKDFAKELKVSNKAEMEKFKAAVEDGVVGSIPHLVEMSPVDTGLYAQSWKFTKTEEMMVIGNFAPHAAVIEFGARPFTPPLGPLLAWARRVLQKSELDSDVYRLAVGTQKKIEREGMEPNFILEHAIPDILENIRRAYLGADRK